MAEGRYLRGICSFSIAFFILLAFSQASTNINVYLSENGDASFVGASDSNLSLPEGISQEGSNIFGITSVLTKKEKDVWSFDYYLQNAQINILLPNNALLLSTRDSMIYVSDEDIVISYKDNSSLTYKFISSNEEQSKKYWIVLFLIVSISLLVYLINFFNKKMQSLSNKDNKIKKEIENSNIANINNLLNERQKLIVNNLRESGKIKMSILRKKCDIPKASFSRHIQELEKKKLIKRSGLGKNKFVDII